MSNNNELAMVKKDTVDVVAEKVRHFQENGEIHFPANYSPENALKSAWLTLQETKDKNGKPVLQTCTRDSIANSLLNMVVQGLNPIKNQGYFIAFGQQLVFMRSYFGTMAVTKRVTGAKDIFAQVVYKGDDFEYEIVNGRKEITKHVQKIENVNGENILAAYCTIVFDGGRRYTEIMTMDEIRRAWDMSRTKAGKTHKEFPQEMAKKTVINRTCKIYLNSSDDSNLVIEHFNQTDESAQEAQIQEEIDENANQEMIDVDYTEVEDETDEISTHDEPEANEPPQEFQQTGTDGPGF